MRCRGNKHLRTLKKQAKTQKQKYQFAGTCDHSVKAYWENMCSIQLWTLRQ